jgi:hypothetical protein
VTAKNQPCPLKVVPLALPGTVAVFCLRVASIPTHTGEQGTTAGRVARKRYVLRRMQACFSCAASALSGYSGSSRIGTGNSSSRIADERRRFRKLHRGVLDAVARRGHVEVPGPSESRPETVTDIDPYHSRTLGRTRRAVTWVIRAGSPPNLRRRPRI